MSSGDTSCARTRGWNWDCKKSQRLESKSSSSDEDMSFNFDDSGKSEQSSDGGYAPEKEPVDLGKTLSSLNVSQAMEGHFTERGDFAVLGTEDEEMHTRDATHERHMEVEVEKSGKHKDEHRRREKDHEKRSKRKEKSKDKLSSRENKRRKEDADDKKSHDKHRRFEKSQKWEREDDGDFYKREKHHERDDERKEKHRADEYSDHDSYRRDRHWDSSRSGHQKGSVKADKEKEVKRARVDGEQRASTRARSPSMSPRANKGGRSPSPHQKEDDKDRSSKEREGSSRYRRSGLGGYSPRRRRSDAAIRTPSPPARSPERRKTRAWDLPPVGMDSGVAAAMAAAHQAAAQQAAALASVSSLVTVNPALAAVSLTQATRNFRRLYIGNVPASVSDGELLEFINAAMLSVNANNLPGTKPCINCMVNVEKSYAFAEFLTPEDATAGLAFDGITLHGTTLKIRRPRDYVPPPNGGVGIGSVVGMVSSVVPDSPQKIFVGGICKTLSAEKVKEIVTAFGQLKAYHWEIAVKNNQIEAFAFLEYLDPSVTLKACAGLNGMRLGNKILTVVQATPDAVSETDGKQDPFYGVPEHAKTLLRAPTRILELQNVITKAEALSMSEAEFLEIEEDVRTECKRFGTVKSTHIVKPETRLDENPQINLGDENSAEQLLLQAEEACVSEVDKRIAEYIASVGGENVLSGGDSAKVIGAIQENNCQSSNASVEETKEAPRAEQLESGAVTEALQVSGKAIEKDGRERQNSIDTIPTDMEEAVQPGMDIEEKNVERGNHGTTVHNADPNVQVMEDVDVHGALTHDSIQPVTQNCDAQGTTMPSTQLVAVGQSLIDMAEAAADAVNAQISEADIGRVYVEFTREEVCCKAAHALHRRLYANRSVIAGYFPLKMYQKKFKKGLEPRTHEERQILALAAQEHLNSFIPDRGTT
ncbi:hypothetical protein GOP47_0021558 [Adiantum capillus-veneris]|uniref:RRM domain-containing protein n=1 Tax=Adiantum capillus-veneris TaxID=13818 RepID=A0A9D4Z7Z7_ADICA|nr:hypothetical protein GOP47_0021558 [Adiantum capillus-veneris]